MIQFSRNLAFFSIVLFGLASCVTTQKYEELVTVKDHYKDEAEALKRRKGGKPRHKGRSRSM